MKSAKFALVSLYINLITIILLLGGLLIGLTNHNIWNLVNYILIAAVIISCIFNVIFAIKNLINTCRLYENRDYNALRKNMKILKLGSIPYFIINFTIYVLLFLFFFAASRGIIIATPIPLLFLFPIFFTYLLVLFTSSYGIGFVAINCKEKRMSKVKVILHILLQINFIFDVLSTIILIIKYKKIV